MTAQSCYDCPDIFFKVPTNTLFVSAIKLLLISLKLFFLQQGLFCRYSGDVFEILFFLKKISVL